MWSLGCVMAELFLGWPLYPGDSEFDQVCFICETQGPPGAHLLDVASKAHLFFQLTEDSQGESHWLLRSNQRRPPMSADGRARGKGSTDRRKYTLTSLDQLETMEFTERDSGLCHQDAGAEAVDRHGMVQLLKQMLTLDPRQRIVPASASQHPFISLQHLRGHPDYRRYREEAARAVGSALIPDTAPDRGGLGSSRPMSVGEGQRCQCAREEEFPRRCLQGRRRHGRRGVHSPPFGGIQWNSPVPHQPDSSTELKQGLMGGLCLVEASPEDAQRGSSPSNSVEPSDLQAGLQSSKRDAFPETEQNRQNPDISSMLSYFPRLGQSQRLRQPLARSSKSDPAPGRGFTSGPQGKITDEPKSSSPFYVDSIIQLDLAEPREQDQEEQAAGHCESLENFQFLHVEPEGYSCDCGRWWPAWTSDPEVANLGYGPPSCCSSQPKQNHPNY